MKSTIHAFFYSALAVVAFSASNPASAQITESFSNTSASAQFPFTENFTLPSFDTSLGTLQAVDLSVQADTTADIKIYNILSNPEAFTNAKASITTTITDPAGTFISVTDDSSLADGSAVPGLNDFPGLPATSTGSIQISPANFAVWEDGSGKTVVLSISAEDGTFSGSSVSGIFFGGIAVEDVSATVTYTYGSDPISAVPEPSTWALLLGGLALLAYWRGRKLRALVGFHRSLPRLLDITCGIVRR